MCIGINCTRCHKGSVATSFRGPRNLWHLPQMHSGALRPSLLLPALALPYLGGRVGEQFARLGHMQPRTEPNAGPTRPSKHAYTATINLEVAPAQPYAHLSQGACDKGCPRNPTRPCYIHALLSNIATFAPSPMTAHTNTPTARAPPSQAP
jgi:hypothetical protein